MLYSIYDGGWVWTSPNGRITHTYFPQTWDAYILYRRRGWQVTRSTA